MGAGLVGGVGVGGGGRGTQRRSRERRTLRNFFFFFVLFVFFVVNLPFLSLVFLSQREVGVGVRRWRSGARCELLCQRNGIVLRAQKEKMTHG